MKKITSLSFFYLTFLANTFGQSATVDKNQVMSYFQDQQFEEALQYMNPSLPADSNNASLLTYIAYAYYMNDNKRAAQDCYQHIYSIDSTNVVALSYLVRLNMDEDREKCMNFASRLLVLQPTKAIWWRTMGELWRRAEQPDTALVFLERAHELAPKDAKSIAILADVLIDKRYYPLSDSLLDGALKWDSMNINFLRLRIRSAYTAGDYESVLAPGERLVKINEPTALVGSLTWLALSYYNLKKYADCIRICEYMRGEGIDLESIYYYEAKALAKMKEYAKSNQLLQICLKKAISPAAEMYYYDMGDNYEGLKMYKVAISQYDTAFYLFKSPAMKYNIGRIYESNLHNSMLAHKYFKEYISYPRPEDSKERKAYDYIKAIYSKSRREPQKK